MSVDNFAGKDHQNERSKEIYFYMFAFAGPNPLFEQYSFLHLISIYFDILFRYISKQKRKVYKYTCFKVKKK